jgi:hypothetical protein
MHRSHFRSRRRHAQKRERSVTTGDSLSGENDVGFEIPVGTGKGLAGTAHASHDFIGNEQDAVLAADFGDASGVTIDGGSGG